MFKSQSDRKGLGHLNYIQKPLSRKDVALEVGQIIEEDRTPHILSLSLQSKWTEWDKLIDLDLKWKEVLYGMSPSTLSFVLNSVQNTLPDPANLRRWNLSKAPVCSLCNWKNVTHVHILCGCKVALEQGRVS